MRWPSPPAIILSPYLTFIAVSSISIVFASGHDNQDVSHTSFNYLLGEFDERLNLQDDVDLKLINILNRDGPDLRTSTDYHDFVDIQVKESQRAWKLMRHHASQVIADKVNHIRPIIQRLLVRTNISLECQQAIGLTLDGAKRLELWAIQLFNSWGSFPPPGMFHGTLSDIGSYHGCLDVPWNPYIGHTHYCTVSYRPVVPSKKPYDLIVRQESQELVHLFDQSDPNNNQSTNLHHDNDTTKVYKAEDMFSKLLNKAQYYHYVYYKIGTCLPRKCSPLDVKLVAKFVGARSILMSGPVKCHSKHREVDQDDNRNVTHNTSFIQKPISYMQKVALTILSLFTLFIVTLSIYDRIMYKYHPDDDTKNISCQSDLFQTPIDNNNNSNNNNNTIDATSEKYRITIDDEVNNNHLSQAEVFQPMMNNSNGQESGYNYNYNKPPALEIVNTLTNTKHAIKRAQDKEWSFIQLSKDFSIVRNWNNYFSTNTNSNDILCLYGLRSITMMWIILTHTMQYNDWSAFARTYEIETAVKSIVIQPLFNASYLVDTFFLMSGMVASYSAWRGCKGKWNDFYKLYYILGRYLRLTPQVFFTSMIFIVLPLVSSGPFWDSMTSEYSENCSKNWWINMLHVQSFYKTKEMCNFVSWWISVDMFFQLTGLLIFILALISQRLALSTSVAIVAGYTIWAVSRHYSMEFPPNLMATVPQVAEMWTDMVTSFFWSPYCHSYPFILGFWVGYKLASGQLKIPPNHVKLGWFISTISLLCVSWSTYLWVIDRYRYTKFLSSLYFMLGPIVWSSSLAWMICACHLGLGGWLNNFLSSSVFIVLGRASYIVYLSHMSVLFLFYGNQNVLIEPAQIIMIYVIIGNIVISLILGSFLYIVYESPCLKLQQRIMRSLMSPRN